MIKIVDPFNEQIAYFFKRIASHKKYKQSLHFFSTWIGKTVLAICSLLLFFGIYLYTSRIVFNNGDNASILLQAYDLLHTSKILRGWYLPTDNFITLDMPLYALGLLAGFKMPVLMKVIPALIYTGVVFSGIYLASVGKTGTKQFFAIMAFTAISAFPSYFMITQLLGGPIHIGTILGTLLAFIAYHSYKEYSYKIASLLAMGILTLLLVIGDPMSEVILVIPIVLVEGIFLYKNRFTSLSQYFSIGTVLSSTLFALYILHIWKAHFVHIQTLNTMSFESVPAMVNHAQDAAQIVFSLFHGSLFQQKIFSPTIIPELLHASFVLLLGIGIWKWLKNIFALNTSQDAITTVLIFAILGNIAAYALTDIAASSALRYLLPVFVFGGIVAFSTLSYIRKYNLYIIVIGLFLLNTALFFHTLYRIPPVIQPEKSVISLLQEKHLTKGIGQYWSAASITGQSNYAITVRQVKVDHQRIHPYFFLANDSWFSDTSLKDSQFIIYRAVDQGFYTASIGSFGKPDHIYKVGEYTILAWNTPLQNHFRSGYYFYIPPGA